MQQQHTEAPARVRIRGYIGRVMPGGYAFVKSEQGQEYFLHLKEFRKGVTSESGLFVSGTFLEFTPEEATPRPRAVKVKVLS